MKKLSIFILAIAALLAPARVQAASLDEAHRAFAEGRYHDSTLAYQSILAEKGYSAPVLFDLGNSHFREGDLAQAILAYKRAQWLAPADADIRANLRQAEARAGLGATRSAFPERIGHQLSVTNWAWIACAAWTVFCLSILARNLLPRQRMLFMMSGAGGALGLLGAIAAVGVSSHELREAVVIDKNAAALISPFPAAQKVFAPSPGETVKIDKEYEDFLLVTDAGGHSGWISKAQIMPVIPSA